MIDQSKPVNKICAYKEGMGGVIFETERKMVNIYYRGGRANMMLKCYPRVQYLVPFGD